MIASANEVTGLAAKAARGAGAGPQQAMEFGRAALCHLSEGRDIADIRAALNALPEGPICALPLAFMALTEQAQGDRADEVISSEGYGDLALSYAQAQVFKVDAVKVHAGVKVCLTLNVPQSLPKVARVQLSDDLAQILGTLAARTFVPESEASRRAGAGAGLTDND